MIKIIIIVYVYLFQPLIWRRVCGKGCGELDSESNAFFKQPFFKGENVNVSIEKSR